MKKRIIPIVEKQSPIPKYFYYRSEDYIRMGDLIKRIDHAKKMANKLEEHGFPTRSLIIKVMEGKRSIGYFIFLMVTW